MSHIVSFLEKHPELGVAPKLSPNSILNDKQVAAVIDYYKKEKIRPTMSNQENNVLKISTTELNPNIKVVGKIDLDSLDQSTRPKKKTMEEKREEREEQKRRAEERQERKARRKQEIKDQKEQEKNSNQQSMQTNETVVPAVHKATYRFSKESSPNKRMEKERFRQQQHLLMKEAEAIITNIHKIQEKSEVSKKQKQIKKELKKNNGFIIVNTNLLGFKYFDGFAFFIHNFDIFTCFNDKFKKDYKKLLKTSKTNLDCKNALNKQIKITLNFSDKTFVCNHGFNIHDYLDVCMQKYVERSNFSTRYYDHIGTNNNSNEQRIYCKIENIEFFDGYYKIWIVKNGVKINKITPLIIQDINSLACLQIVSKYIATRLPNDIMIIYTSNQVLRLDNEFKLQKYVETLKKSKEIPTDWWNSSDNKEFKTLENYRKIPYSIVNKEVSYKNVYIDYLTSYQSETPLLIAYEVFNGQEEKCFVFNVSLDDKRSAIIYENININRATNVFIIDKQDYEESMNLIFNYFTDEDLSRKRLSIRTNQNPPEKFKAIDVKTINHDNLSLWINKLNELIIPSSKQIDDDKTPEHIQFVLGLNLKSGNTERVNTKGTIAVTNLHDEIKEKLYLQLIQKYGADNVGTEISIGQKKIDLVVRNHDSYDLYEIKTNKEVRICIREAIGQIIDYAFFECQDKVGKMTIVGPTQITIEASEYLQNIRCKHSLPIYYESIN